MPLWLKREYLSNFNCSLIGPYARTFFSFLEKQNTFSYYLRSFFVFVNIRSKIFKVLYLLQIAAKSFRISPEFASQWSSHKYTFGLFENWNFNDSFFVFLNMEPNRIKHFKTRLPLQIKTEGFQTCPEFSSQSSWQNFFEIWVSDL